MNIVHVVLTDYHHDVDGYEEVATSILSIFSKFEDADKVADAYNDAHPVNEKDGEVIDDYWYEARVETWGVDNINADDYVEKFKHLIFRDLNYMKRVIK